MESTTPRHPIQVVVRRTGLSADVIRVWERRYAAVQPERDAAGRRIYTDEQVERLGLLRALTQGGRRIREVAGLELEALRALEREDRAGQATAIGKSTSAAQPGATVEAYLAALESMEAPHMEALLERASVLFSVPVILEEILTPILTVIGERCSDGDLRVSQEHLASTQIRAFLAGLRRTNTMSGEGPVLLVTTPSGQQHELGAIMVTLTADTEGWNAVHLGANTPASEIVSAAQELNAWAVALSVVYPVADARTVDELERLRRLLPEEIKLLVGGSGSNSYGQVLTDIGAQHLDSLAELRAELARLREQRGAAA